MYVYTGSQYAATETSRYATTITCRQIYSSKENEYRFSTSSNTHTFQLKIIIIYVNFEVTYLFKHLVHVHNYNIYENLKKRVWLNKRTV